jgi:hypothetical protein
MTVRRQPLEARVWGRVYRSWYTQEGRQKKKAKRRSAKRERHQAREAIRTSVWELGPHALGLFLFEKDFQVIEGELPVRLEHVDVPGFPLGV